MARLKCWKKAKKTGYIARWNEKHGTGVVVVNKVASKRIPRFEVMYSYALGGWHALGVKKDKDVAIKRAIKYMKENCRTKW